MKRVDMCLRFLIPALLLGVVASAQAANWSVDFDGPLPPSWVTLGITEPADGPSATFSAVVESGYLRMSDTTAAQDGGVFSAYAGTTDDVFTDVIVSAVVNPAKDTNDDLGVVARADDVGHGYFGNVDYELGQACIAKLRGFNRGDDMVCSDLGSLDSGESYFLKLSATGGATTNLTLDVYDDLGGSLIQSVSATDDGTFQPPLFPEISPTPAYTAGISGVFIVPKGQFVDPDAISELVNGTFDNISSVPEPATATLLLLAGVVTILGRRRTR